MKRLLVIVAVLFVAVCVIVVFTVRNRSVWSRSHPDNEVRGAVATVTPGQIAAVRLEILPDMMIITPDGKIPDRKKLELQPGFQYKYTQNPEAIALLLKGLQEATQPPEYRLDRINNIALILKDGTIVGPFGFNQSIRVDAFSPAFIEGLKKAGARSIPRQ